jgi:beta-lactamase class D
LADGDLHTGLAAVDFLRRLYHNDLPFSQRSMDIVKDILVIEKTPEYVLHAKTGWGARLTPQVGWWVGYLEQGGNVYFFATNLDIVKPGDEDARISVTQDILRSLGLLDAANNR